MNIKSIRNQVPLGLFNQVFHCEIKRGKLLRRFLRPGLQQSNLLRRFVNMHDVHGGRSESAKHRRKMKHDRLSHVSLVPLDVRRPRPSANKQNEILRTVSAQMHFFHNRRSHVPIHNLSNDLRRLLDLNPQRPRNLVSNRLDRRILVQAHSPAEIIFRVDVAEHNIRIGDRRFFSPTVKASRPRHRASAFRPHLHPILQKFVEPRDRAAARSDRQRLDHRDAHHPPIDDRPEIIAAHAVLHH